MRFAPRRQWLLASAVVFALAAAAGLALAGRVTPELLRAELERRLGEALGSPVRVGSVRISLGLPVDLVGFGVEAFDAPGGPALRVERVVVRVRPFAPLTGRRPLGRLVLVRPLLRVQRDAAGRWYPPPAAALLAEGEPAARRGSRHPDEILSPLIVLEATARRLLTSPLPAHRLELRDGRIEWAAAAGERSQPERARGARARGRPEPAPREPGDLAWVGIEAELRRRPLLGETRLHLYARLADRAGERGAVELEGRLARGGAVRVAAAATDLDLAAAAALPSALAPRLRLAGGVSGVVLFDAPEPGSGRLEVDLVGRDVRGAASEREPRLGPLAARRFELAGVLEIDPQTVRLRGASLRSDRLALRLEGLVERPLQRASTGELSLALEEVRLRDVRRLLAWLPEVEREEAEGLLANLRKGRLHRLEVGGAATLGEWQEFLAGRSRRMPRDFFLRSELAEVRLRAGDDRIEELGGRLAWTSDRLEVRGLHARLGGRPLPVLDLDLEGISSFFATDPDRRRLTTSAPPLAGLGALWRDLRPEPEGDQPGRMPVAVSLAIERLEHPMFLWPIEGLVAEIAPQERGVGIEARGGTWGGVPIELSADWLFEPEEQVHARVVAGVESEASASGSPAGAPEARASAAGGSATDPTHGSAAEVAFEPRAPEASAQRPMNEPQPQARSARSEAQPSEGHEGARSARSEAQPSEGGPRGTDEGGIPEPDATWARGRLAVGPVEAARWRQRAATARFEVHGAELRLFDGQLDLLPQGRGVANARIDLSRAEAAPFELGFELQDGDLPTLGAAVRLPPQLASGRVDAAGSVAGAFDPGAPLAASLQGRIDVEARDGAIRKEVPAVLALALASEVLTPISRRDQVRYARIRTRLELGQGRLSTDGLSLDGPDARAFASGQVALGAPPHAIDVQVVLFLFRQVDWVLDKIPLVNLLLLGPDRNLLAAHYQLSGSWEEPSVRLVPLQSLASGPLVQGLPAIVTRGLEALGGLVGRDRGAGEEPGEGARSLPPRES